MEALYNTILLNYALIIYSFFIILESIISNFFDLKWYNVKDLGITLWLGLCGVLFDLLMKTICFFVLNYFSINFGLFHWSNTWVMWLFVFISQDFCFYWLHRAEHYIRILWAVHINHHSSEKFNFSIALRSSVLQPLYRYIFFIPCAIMGFDAFTIMFIYAINQYWAFFVHTKSIGNLGIFEYFLVTPSHHRVHHGSNLIYLDKNMGQVLIIWDKIFGTFQKETEEVHYGLTKNINNYNLFDTIFSEWVAIFKDLNKRIPLKAKLKYLIKPPGWSHDGSTLTSNQLRNKNI